MANADDRYKLTINVTLEREARANENDSVTMMTNDLQYSKLKYKDVVMIEGLLTDVIEDLQGVAAEQVENMEEGGSQRIDEQREKIRERRSTRRMPRR